MTPPPGKDPIDIVISIDKKPTSLDTCVCLLETMQGHALWKSLEFGQQEVQSLADENATLREMLKSLTEGMTGSLRKIKTHLKLLEETGNNISFHRIYRLGG